MTASTSAPARTAPVILVVDDDSDTLDALREVLADAGFRVLTAENGRDALTFLRGMPPPDLALVDLMMPGMDGWTFASEVRQDARLARTPLVVMSAGGERVLARAPIARAYLRKPLDLTQLLSVVHHHARRDRSAETLRSFRLVGTRHVSTQRTRVPIVLAVSGDETFLDAHRETVACGGAVLHAATADQAVARATEASVVAILTPNAAGATWLGERVAPTLRLLVASELTPYQLEAGVRAAVQRAPVDE